MDLWSDCVTEVPLPSADSLQRLQRHLPRSSYTYGAVYEAAEWRNRCWAHSRAGQAVPDRFCATSKYLLILKAEFKWRFGGRAEKRASPPWLFGSEQLCDTPYRNQARDLHRFRAEKREAVIPQDPAAFIIRLALHSRENEHVAIEFLGTASIHAFPGWLSEEWFECDGAADDALVDHAFQQVCFLSYEASVNVGNAVSTLEECLCKVATHAPSLNWHVGVLKLIGSVRHHKLVDAL
ncbi:hypothetical protein Q7P37_003284 [Cladosporium fusiforme]